MGGSRALDSGKEHALPAIPEYTPADIYRELDRYVVGQERAKRKIAIAAYGHVQRLHRLEQGEPSLLRKSNLLLYGPTGCGKTYLARQLARLLALPIVIVDATDYTEAGYYGKDVETIVGELLITAGSVHGAERGIVFLDEIDKIATRTGSARTGAGNRDIGGEGVQQALLKLLEGKIVYAPVNVTQHWNKHDFVAVDVSNILFICAGAFSDIASGRERSVSGFSDRPEPAISAAPQEEFRQYGLSPEFLGRLPVRVRMAELDQTELRTVLTDPPDSPLREYTERLSYDGVELVLDEDALAAVARHAQRSGQGARALRAALEEILEEALFSSPEARGTRVVITGSLAEERLRNLAA